MVSGLSPQCFLGSTSAAGEPSTPEATQSSTESIKPAQKSEGIEGHTASDGKREEFLKIAGQVLSSTGQPEAGASIQVINRFLDMDLSTKTGQDGRFMIEFPYKETDIGRLRIIATSADFSELSFLGFTQRTTKRSDLETLKIELKTARSAQVKVVDQQGNPVPAANVALQLSYPNTIHALANTDGLATFQLPHSEEIASVVAWKDHAGLDYKIYSLPPGQENDQLAEKPDFPSEIAEVLTLEGAAPLTVTLADAEGLPLPGTRTYVWALQKRQDGQSLNLSLYYEYLAETSESSGKVAFNWFPAWQEKNLTLWATADGFVRTRIPYNPAADAGNAAAQLERLVPIRGTVTFRNGEPAAGIKVQAVGAGYGVDHFHGDAITDDSGRYEILAAPNQIYLLYVADQKWAASSQSGFALLPGKVVEDRNFVLKPTTKVFGRVLNKATGEPVGGKVVALYERGVALHLMGKDILPNPSNRRTWVCPSRTIAINSDAEGRYEIFLGEGRYSLARGDIELMEIAPGEVEKQLDIPIEIDSRTKVKFNGTVVDQANKPVSGAIIHAISLDFRYHGGWRATTNSEGKFQVERYAEPTMLHVKNLGDTLGAMVEIAADQTEVDIQLSELGKSNGRLMSKGGAEPVAGVKLKFGVQIKDIIYPRFGTRLLTDARGDFSLAGLVPGAEYICTLDDPPGGYILTVAKVVVKPGQTLELGELEMPVAPKPYVPPTLDDRIETAFNVNGTPLERFERAKQLVQNVNQNLLILFARPDDPCVKALMRIRYEDEDFRPYRDDFLIMAIPTDHDRFKAAQDLATALELASFNESDDLRLIVVNRDGEVVGQLGIDQLCDGDSLSKEHLFTHLDKHKIQPLDARKLLDEALATAARENKRVLVQETATWCGPCHQLSKYLQANRQWEKDYVWVKMDHRWTGAIEIMRQLRDGASGGIPWFAILDSSGKKLATSNLPDSGENIGFPSSKEGREHFANMLKSTRQHMTDQDLDDLVQGNLNQD
jgi:hypothetical protein